MTQISCVYNRTATGRLALAFAADLWRLIDAASMSNADYRNPMHVYLNSDPRGAAVIGEAQHLPANELITIEAKLVHADVLRKTGMNDDQIAIDSQHADGIVVDHNLAFVRNDLSVLFPCRESTVFARGSGPILIPFGDGQSVLPAAHQGLKLAQMLGVPVVFYHTTWAVPGLEDAPANHMCRSAKQMLLELQMLADKYVVSYTQEIELADDVVEGLLQCALRNSARLIVMSRSAKTTVGCYVSQTLRKTPIPVLAMASPKRQGGAA